MCLITCLLDGTPTVILLCVLLLCEILQGVIFVNVEIIKSAVAVVYPHIAQTHTNN